MAQISPQRLPDEPYTLYRLRRRAQNLSIKRYLRGQPVEPEGFYMTPEASMIRRALYG